MVRKEEQRSRLSSTGTILNREPGASGPLSSQYFRSSSGDILFGCCSSLFILLFPLPAYSTSIALFIVLTHYESGNRSKFFPMQFFDHYIEVSSTICHTGYDVTFVFPMVPASFLIKWSFRQTCSTSSGLTPCLAVCSILSSSHSSFKSAGYLIFFFCLRNTLCYIPIRLSMVKS